MSLMDIGDGYFVDSETGEITQSAPDTTTYKTDGYTDDPVDTKSYSGFNLKDIGNLLKGTSSLGMAGQLAGLGGIGTLLNKMMGGGGGGGPSGYQGSIPKYTASRQQYAIPPSGSQSAYKPPEFERPNYDAMLPMMGGSPQRMAGIGALSSSMVQPNYQTPARPAARRPGSGGVTYFSPMQYIKAGEAPAAPPVAAPPESVAAPTNPTIIPQYAQGGITNLGGYSDGGQLLRGPGDGVSDDIPATIGNKQPARLADGEFVIPARIVSELGNGSTDAGARKLYAMMDRIKKTRAKAKNIAANTKTDKHLPA